MKISNNKLVIGIPKTCAECPFFEDLGIIPACKLGWYGRTPIDHEPLDWTDVDPDTQRPDNCHIAALEREANKDV